MAAFAYFRVELIDLASSQVVNEMRVIASAVHATPNRMAQHSWNSLTGTQKVNMLQELVSRETTRVIPKLVETTP